MINVRTYPYKGRQVSVKEVVALHTYPGVKLDWIRRQLNHFGLSVEEVLAKNPLSQQQVSRRGAKSSPWSKHSETFRSKW